ncbi:hypothetical protein [Streptomyces sp. NPDC052015]|uniref:hypothetical protein n=1 Tax=Streptomyces sp. NPDC052015 TaxID=3154755 RepID=UPI00341849F2
MSARDEAVEMIRRICPAHLSADEYGQILAEKLDAYRTEVLAKAIGRLRAIPVTCTALTGPVWYGDGWNSAITCLEEIAEYQVPDDEAYPGELQMLRALALGVRVAARKGDMNEVQRLALDHAARDGDARDNAKQGAADFFQPGHTYTDGNGYRAPEITTIFRVEHVTRHPDRGHLRAIGWAKTGEPGSKWHGDFRDEGEFGGWTELTEESR